MPKELNEQRACCLVRICCPLPTASTNGSDDKGDHGEDEGEADDMDVVVTGLLSLALTP